MPKHFFLQKDDVLWNASPEKIYCFLVICYVASNQTKKNYFLFSILPASDRVTLSTLVFGDDAL
jgi:hypothetical protein